MSQAYPAKEKLAKDIPTDIATASAATAISTAVGGPAGAILSPIVNNLVTKPAANAVANMSEDTPRGNSMSDIFTKKLASRKYAWTFIFVVMVILLIMFICYFEKSPESFGLEKDMSSGDKFVNSLYFWSTTSSTIGYGDVCARSNKAKLLVVAYELFLLAVGIGFILNIKDRHVEKHFDNMKRSVTRRNGFSAPSE